MSLKFWVFSIEFASATTFVTLSSSKGVQRTKGFDKLRLTGEFWVFMIENAQKAILLLLWQI